MKHSLIMSGVYDKFLFTKKAFYLAHEDYNNKALYLHLFDKETIDECFKIYNATRQRKKNNWLELCKWCFAIQHMNHYRDHKIIFGTLTFKDKVLQSTSSITRQRYVTRFLKDNTIHYVANIDFGKKNNREHYHFVALVDDKMNCNKWLYGASKFQFVPLEKNDLKSVKNYLLKLNNHSYKDTTRQKRIIRDRKQDLLEIMIDLYEEEFRRYKLGLDAY